VTDGRAGMTARQRAMGLASIAGVVVFGMTALAQSGAPARYGIGRAATPDEVKALDIDVMPDGRGLPPGRGTVREGAAVFAAKCASCHGAKGEGGSAERLVGRNDGDSFAYATNAKLIRTIGSYWPYATTLYDYTFRSMPFTQPGTLTANETYSLVAFLLYQNDVVKEDTVMDAASLPRVVMPAKGHFVVDDRKGGKVVK
jgi:S-disulfanyl-L-cysteine oxidoreductase SoxD